MPDLVRTADVPDAERFDYWHNAVCETFVPLEASAPRDGGPFRGTLRGVRLGALRVYEVDADRHAVRRTPRLISASDSDYYKLGLQLEGQSVLCQDGRETTLAAGDFAVYDTTRPYTFSFDDAFRLLVMIFPRRLLGLPASRVAGVTATAVSGRTGLGTLIGPFLVQIGKIVEDVNVPGSLRLADNVLDLLTTTLADRLEVAPADAGCVQRALFVRITAFIEERLGDPNLSPGQIAAAHHISTRYLHKLFHAEDTTVLAWIRGRRLEHCGRDLRDPLQLARPVSAIAARWGYLDAAHFSRLFKAAYECSPREYRARHQPAGAAPRPA